MLRFPKPLLITAAFMLSACVTTGSQPSSADGSPVTVLQAGEWRIQKIAGASVIDNSPATLMFDHQGQLSGNASCNKLIASYTVQGDKLTISPVGTTRMACPPAFMNQERRLVDLLGKVTRYDIDGSGALVLTSASEERIVARR
ncbi:MAG: META domain-containing protein [Sphingomonas sp.]|uniref:META domain-containing protein n=1 Tax=Sphingomonas sp. TaxID=28214 RepID=UPI0026376D56|nr:META domain-containing protein [Sphingomonas sp.]MDK2768302.1 META domain-containing protein [Sphingomonas sp.]